MAAPAVPVHRPRRGVVAAVVALAAVVGGVALLGGGAGSPVPVVSVASPKPVDVIAEWLAANRDEAFPGAEGGEIGTCPDEAPAGTVGLCSALREDLGDRQIHLTGAYATDWGADLLLERTASGWAVVDWAPWPEGGTRWFGPPWSPLAAIGEWWSTRSELPHVGACPAEPVEGVLCSTFVGSEGDVRRYRSGDLDLVAEAQADGTWVVSEDGCAPATGTVVACAS